MADIDDDLHGAPIFGLAWLVSAARVSPELKARVESIAREEHRSLSSQIEYELIRALRGRVGNQPQAVGHILGRFEDRSTSLSDRDVEEARRLLWGRLRRAGGHETA